MDLVISSEDFRRLSPATQKELLAVLMGGDSDGDAMFGMDDYDSVPGSNTQGGSTNAGKRVFAESERVSVDELVGDGRPYKDMNDLKRSFVGAVNRRLRTVVGNRSAVLFSSDRDRQKIRVLPAAASALRQAMGIAEPEFNNAIDGADNEYEFEAECVPESTES